MGQYFSLSAGIVRWYGCFTYSVWNRNKVICAFLYFTQQLLEFDTNTDTFFDRSVYKLFCLGARSVNPTALHITIPDANSPNKFLPCDPSMDTSNMLHAGQHQPADFLRSIQGTSSSLPARTGQTDARPGEESDDFYACRLDSKDMNQTCRDEVTMCR